ncbi:MAG: 2-oxo acid dehydrogenase subunit E2 [Chloroflexi bacterium]|nr:2-oxo acid dehydrogenase subunit E2 [Chloroflexota bacterium]
MPRLSDTMEEGAVAAWLKREGERIEVGEPIAEIQTDKATMEMPVYHSGVLERIIVPEGQTVPIGTPIAVITTDAEARGGAPAAAPPAEPPALPTQAAATALAVAPGGAAAAAYAPAPPAALLTGPSVAAAGEAERVKASPLARRLAQELGMDLRHVPGSGPGGRVVRDDVLAFHAQVATMPAPAAAPPAAPAAAPAAVAVAAPAAPLVPPPAGPRVVELTRMQQVIARRMVESKTTIPHFYLTAEIDMVEAVRLAQQVAEAWEQPTRLPYNEIVLKAVALALRRVPDVNATFRENRVEIHDRVNVGFAVAVESGLVVPVIRDCDRKVLREIADDARELAEKARSGRLALADYEGGTFTVSNLGMFDIDEFVAIINPPQTGILAVGAVRPKAVVHDGQIVARERMRVTLSGDHRAYYGATGAVFLRELKRLLEQPVRLFL